MGNDSISTYAFASLGWLSLQAVPLIVWPTFISSMLTENGGHAHAPAVVNVVETYFARYLGFSQLTIGLLIVTLSGALPLTTNVTSPNDPNSPYANAVVFISMFYHTIGAAYGYSRYTSSGGHVGYLLGFTGSAIMSAYALWLFMFAGEQGKVNATTGADKRTSNFPFKNAEAEKRFDGDKKRVTRKEI
ncbi:hypothetical protein NEUTE1DRAFT_142486 [Neurospora tetrasperma FGSC 2508]|uniref:Uncharacterized protein n=1 Tax=Neurospora tetrasperma (strain FGSC 2508 / ATCC MYA-4615 / P0657) TaxID=510951 RepID=F8N3K2_NEUT8|nr:uncharacterized protein NEUTE1DRAFT_142486 [Neurospora tetrasperma FGSC 2508]EGO52607.1 hypothetical protein NEUTE1DRAFT_142486 [Neurospora tetrasperma FGSC 2508]